MYLYVCCLYVYVYMYVYIDIFIYIIIISKEEIMNLWVGDMIEVEELREGWYIIDVMRLYEFFINCKIVKYIIFIIIIIINK